MLKDLLARFALLAALPLLSDVATARVVVVARPGPAGPAGWLAGEQIAHWPTHQPVQIFDHDPENLPGDTTLIIELTEDFDFRADYPAADGDVIRVLASPASIDHATALANKAADAINHEIGDPSETFKVESQGQASQAVPRIVVITSTKDEINRQRISKRTRQLRVATQAILAAEQVIDAAVTPQRIAADAKPGVLRVAFYDDLGARNRTAGQNPVWVRQSMRGQADFDVFLVSAQDIRAGALRGQFDVVILGGGSSKTESQTLGDEGRKAIQGFVNDGGGYVGICAGAFLAARNSYGLGISPVKTRQSHAGSDVTMRLSDDARRLSSIGPSTVTSTIHGGPILSLADDSSQFHANIWATFSEDLKRGSAADDEDDEKEPGAAAKAAGRIIPLHDTPSVVSSDFGHGRVVIFSPHCERLPGPQSLFWTAVRWAGQPDRK